MTVRFLVTNRANPNRPVPVRWSSACADLLLPVGPATPQLSDGLGLQHIGMVANACGMTAALWQTGPWVFFELVFQTVPAASPKVSYPAQASPPPLPFPPGLNVLCLDDSSIARKCLRYNLQIAIPDGEVGLYGANLQEVEAFKCAALEHGDILIVDEQVDLPDTDTELRGTAIVEELIAAGYGGFACIRSGDSSDADKARSRACGAHWHVGKEEPIRDMIAQLRVEYNNFLQDSKEESCGPVPKATSCVTFAPDLEHHRLHSPSLNLCPFQQLSSRSPSCLGGLNGANTAPNGPGLFFARADEQTRRATRALSSSSGTVSSRGTSYKGALSTYGVLSVGP